MPPAHGRRTEGGEGAQRCCLRRGIDVSGSRANPSPARRRIAKTTTKTMTNTGGHRRWHRQQRSPGLVPMIGREVVADGSDVYVGGGGGSGGGGGGDSPPTNRSPLKCDIYLIAHPLMTDYFARSVIVILNHTEEGPRRLSETKEGGGINEGGVGGFGGGVCGSGGAR